MTVARTGTAPEVVRETLRTRLVEFLAEYGFLVFFGLWVAFLALATPLFLTPQNIILLLRQAAIFGIPAIGATFVLILGELDISFGSTIGLAGAVGASLIVAGVDPLLGILAGIGVGLLIGLVNGFLVTVVRIPSVVATLGMLGIVLGIGLVYTGGRSIFGPQLDPILPLAQGWLGPVPIPVVILFLAYGLAWFVLTQTRFGMHVYLVGDNAEAAYRAGIPVQRIKMAVFALAGATAGLGGMILVARVSQAQASLGSESLFPVLTAVILGGVSLTGGRGRVENTLIASVFLASIVNGLILLGVDPNAQRVIQGAILVLAVSLDRLRR
jgi:ribose/xylose/arabinose/galactoside ABC-type transport system permease subunit